MSEQDLIVAEPKFRLGDVVRKKSGSAWQGAIVGTYSTSLTPEGYAVESDAHPGSVQIYPAAALELVCPTPGVKASQAPSNAHVGPPDWLRLAQECGGTVYRHRSDPKAPGVAFGDESWARFTAALSAIVAAGVPGTEAPSRKETLGRLATMRRLTELLPQSLEKKELLHNIGWVEKDIADGVPAPDHQTKRKEDADE